MPKSKNRRKKKSVPPNIHAKRRKLFANIPKEHLMKPGILSASGISDIQIGEEIRLDGSEFLSTPTLGVIGSDDDALGLFAGSRSLVHGNNSINTIHIPYSTDGALSVNDGNTAVAVNTFYSWGNGKNYWPDGKIHLVRTRSPVILDGLVNFYYDLDYGYRGPKHLMVNGDIAKWITIDKLQTKQIWVDAGINTPDYLLLKPQFDRVASKIDLEESISGDYAVKPRRSAKSLGVMMFARSYGIDALLDHASFLEKSHEGGILVEERKEPLRWVIAGQPQDSNVRCWVSLEENPMFLDGFVRYNTKSDEPVATHKGAKTALFENVPWMTEDIFNLIQKESVAATKAIYNAVKSKGETPIGYIGLDLIVGLNNGQVQINFLEADAGGFGGWGTASKLHYNKEKSLSQSVASPLPSVETAIRRLEPLLVENYHNRGENSNFTRSKNEVELYLIAEFNTIQWQLGRIPPGNIGLAIKYIIHLYQEAISIRPHYVDAHLALAGLYEKMADKGMDNKYYKYSQDIYKKIIGMDILQADLHFSTNLKGALYFAKNKIQYLEVCMLQK
ncbi:hypothetical protein CMO93_04730 [Candidatus Woesearchaeota archaeon]|nr:hypothetical protein [Candidatus Woesearchaeota archaeon]